MNRAKKLAKRNYSFIIQKDEIGYYIVVPDLKGCSTWVRSFDEIEEAVYQAKLAWIEVALEKKWNVPEPTDILDLASKNWSLDKKSEEEL